jgi:hypothetical protein
MRDCRDVIMLAKPGYIYVVRNGGKNGSGKTGGGKKEAGRPGLKVVLYHLTKLAVG